MVDYSKRLMEIFELLFAYYGPRNWWPGDTPLEIAIGAILTQNTAWRNVEKAIQNLKSSDLLDAKKLYEIHMEDLADIIRPSGFYNIKAKRLKNFIKLICEEYDGEIERLKIHGDEDLRVKLLEVKGIGCETGDSIMLYALNRPIFVVDAYTKRFLKNHGLYKDRFGYNEIQKFFMENLPKDAYLFNEYHALIVSLGKDYCKKTPKCSLCPLKEDLRFS